MPKLYVPPPQFSAMTNAKNNAELIVLARKLGHLPDDALVLDMTYGKGVWWKLYRPARFITNDLGKGVPDVRFDFCHPPFAPNTFDVVVYDPPYKLNGTPDADVDERYGVEVYTKWRDRMALIERGFLAACDVAAPGGKVLAKVQDQVCSGQVRWQTMMLWQLGEANGMRLVDELHLGGGRKQGKKVSQKHARHYFSTLQVFVKKGRRKKR